MKCIKCGQEMSGATQQTLLAEVRGEQMEVTVIASRCPGCERVMLNSKARRMYNRAAADAYRLKHGLLTTTDMDTMRRSLGMTWKQFAEYVSIGIATFKRWMGGEIQSPSLDTLVRLKADLSFVQRAADELYARLAVHSPASRVETVLTAPVRTRPPVEWQHTSDDATPALAA